MKIRAWVFGMLLSIGAWALFVYFVLNFHKVMP